MPTRAEAQPIYAKILSSVKITDWGKQQASRLANIIRHYQDEYEEVSKATGVPWQFVAALHHMECSGNFGQHLANGDPITAPTVQVPAGIPAGTWVQCAIAALEYKKWDKNLSWDDWLTVLYRAEAYNGFGYWEKHPSPYLWSGTTAFTKGKYVSDGRYDPEAKSEQVGVYPILVELGLPCLLNEVHKKSSDAIPGTGAKEMSDIKLQIKTRTWLKSSTAQSTDPLSDPKVQLSDGTDLGLSCVPEIKNRHYEVSLAAPYMGIAKGYVWTDHAIIEGEDPDVVGSIEPLKPIDLDDYKAIQENLIRIGLLDPFADGKFGSLSRSSWGAFRRILTGERDDVIDQKSLDALVRFKSAKDLQFKARVDDAEHAIAVKALNRMVALGFPINVSMGSDKPTYNIVYVSGMDPTGELNDNAIDAWNDLRFLIKVDIKGVVDVALCKLATVDAGRHWRDNPMNPLGTAQVDLDQYLYNCHCKGRHGSKQYPALVQVGDIKITRDLDGVGLRNKADKHYVGNFFGMNQHHAYNQAWVGIMSAGCFVGQSIAGHELFMKLLEGDRRYLCNNGFAWSTAILDGRNL